MERRGFLALATAGLARMALGQGAGHDWSIRQGEGVGPIDFGMKPRRIRRLLGSKPDPNPMGPYAPRFWDNFGALGIRVHYTHDSERCCAVAFAPDQGPSLWNKTLTRIPSGDLVDRFREADEGTLIDSGGWTSAELGVTVHAPGWQLAPSRPPSGILVFAEGFLTENIE